MDGIGLDNGDQEKVDEPSKEMEDAIYEDTQKRRRPVGRPRSSVAASKQTCALCGIAVCRINRHRSTCPAIYIRCKDCRHLSIDIDQYNNHAYECNQLNSRPGIIACPRCDKTFDHPSRFGFHNQKIHRGSVYRIKTIVHPDMNSLLSWKHALEIESGARFRAFSSASANTKHYRCVFTFKKGDRRLNGTTTCETACAAFIDVQTWPNGVLRTLYSTQHLHGVFYRGSPKYAHMIYTLYREGLNIDEIVRDLYEIKDISSKASIREIRKMVERHYGYISNLEISDPFRVDTILKVSSDEADVEWDSIGIEEQCSSGISTAALDNIIDECVEKAQKEVTDIHRIPSPTSHDYTSGISVASFTNESIASTSSLVKEELNSSLSEPPGTSNNQLRNESITKTEQWQALTDD